MSERKNAVQEMTQYRDRLIKQKNFLVEMLTKIDNQIHALQVERLHLRSILLGPERSGNEMLPDASERKSNVVEPTTSNHDQDPMKQELDLSVPQSQYDCEEEEIDNEEIIQNEMKILEHFDKLL